MKRIINLFNYIIDNNYWGINLNIHFNEMRNIDYKETPDEKKIKSEMLNAIKYYIDDDERISYMWMNADEMRLLYNIIIKHLTKINWIINRLIDYKQDLSAKWVYKCAIAIYESKTHNELINRINSVLNNMNQDELKQRNYFEGEVFETYDLFIKLKNKNIF